MLFDKEYLRKQFEENSEGLSEGKFIEKKASQLLNIWIEHDKGEEFYKNTGPYFEVFYEILKKYVPEKLLEYEKLIKPIDFFSEEVKREYNYNSDILNFMASLSYLSEREMNISSPQDVHYIELGGIEVPYMPNSNIDKNQFLGREGNAV